MIKDNTQTAASLFTVAPAPHWHCGQTIPKFMIHTIIALLPAVCMSVAIFGIEALRVISLSCASAVVAETICLKVMKREIAVDDYSAIVTGLLFAFLLPASAPWWLVIIGSGLSIALGKMAFGGLGGNPLCAPVVGWAICKISWHNFMDIDASMLNTELLNPLSHLKYFGIEAASKISYADMLTGHQLGGLGNIHIIALIIGGSYLIFKGNISYHIPISFLAGVFMMALIFYFIDSNLYASPVFHLLSGSVILGAFFLAPDTSSSPVGKIPMLLYGFIAGVLVIIIRVYGIYADGVPFAILLTNLLTPLLDRIRPKPFGKR